jgi:hypothetical protein
MARGPNAPRRKVIGLVCLLFLSACLLPCIDCGPGRVPSSDGDFPDFTEGSHLGLAVLLLGWGGANHGVPWSANVFLGLGLLCLGLRQPRAAAVLGLIASCLGLTTWAMNWFTRPHDYRVMVGYYFWQASLLALAAGALWVSRRSVQGPKAIGQEG